MGTISQDNIQIQEGGLIKDNQETFEHIFNLNNYKALENELNNCFTEDDYKYSKESNGNLSFISSANGKVEIKPNGEIVSWPNALPKEFSQIFSNIYISRMTKTSNMFDKLMM